ncbi:hypothetical protein LTR85_012088 [Meristemomyces frigidus]|nr:hypothetical protein LTR85_012088 [Meristemomyces frigidus]
MAFLGLAQINTKHNYHPAPQFIARNPARSPCTDPQSPLMDNLNRLLSRAERHMCIISLKYDKAVFDSNAARDHCRTLTEIVERMFMNTSQRPEGTTDAWIAERQMEHAETQAKAALASAEELRFELLTAERDAAIARENVAAHRAHRSHRTDKREERPESSTNQAPKARDAYGEPRQQYQPPKDAREKRQFPRSAQNKRQSPKVSQERSQPPKGSQERSQPPKGSQERSKAAPEDPKPAAGGGKDRQPRAEDAHPGQHRHGHSQHHQSQHLRGYWEEQHEEYHRAKANGQPETTVEEEREWQRIHTEFQRAKAEAKQRAWEQERKEREQYQQRQRAKAKAKAKAKAERDSEQERKEREQYQRERAKGSRPNDTGSGPRATKAKSFQPPEAINEFFAAKTLAFADYTAIRTFPEPEPWVPCASLACRREEKTRALLACPCVIKTIFGGLDKGQLKTERTRWHPDKWAKCEESLRAAFQAKGQEMFVISDRMYQQKSS